MREFNKHKAADSKHDYSNIRRAADAFFDVKDEYICDKLSEFSDDKIFPSSISKQNGVIMIFVTKGMIKLILGYEQSRLTEGQMAIIQPQKPYAIKQISEDVEGYVLVLNEGSVLGSMGSHSLIFNLDFIETWSDSKYEIKDIPIGFIENIFKRIYWEKKNKKSKFAIINAYVITLLLEFNNIYNEAVDSNKAAIEITRKFKNEVYQNLGIQISVSEYASKLAITPNHLNKSIRSHTGMSASLLISKIKITEAKYLLMMSDFNVSEVAEKLGFEDASYFSRFFKKHESMSPIEFQKMIDLS